MTISTRSTRFQTTRRTILAYAIAGLLIEKAQASQDPSTLRVGLLPFGTVQWEIETLRHHGFDKAEGIRVEAIPLASTDAARIAFLSGSVDTIVQDLLFAARLKSEGRTVLFLPQSSTEGELLVPPASSIRTLADLKGKKIGVAGGPLDKNWLFLRAVALKQAELDLTKDATAIFGAAPLLAAKLESGELDSGLLYWSQAARLEAKGYRRISSTREVLQSLGAKGQVAIGGYLFGGQTSHRTLRSFRKALRATEHLLSNSVEAWSFVRPLMKAPDEATFQVLRTAYLRGIPRKARPQEITDARAFFAIIKNVGGDALLGSVSDLPDDLYVDADIFG